MAADGRINRDPALVEYALAHGIGAPILCDGTCDTCDCWWLDDDDDLCCEAGAVGYCLLGCECNVCTEQRWERG